MHRVPGVVDQKIVSALTAANVGTSEMATIQLSQGRFVRAIVESDHGKLLSLGAGEEALPGALGYDDANLGPGPMAIEGPDKQVQRVQQGWSAPIKPSGRDPAPRDRKGTTTLLACLVVRKM